MGISTLWLVLLFCIHLARQHSIFSAHFMGIRPGSFSGLIGVFTAPFFHGSWTHLLSNAIPFFVLINVFLNLYSSLVWRVFSGILFISGLLVWLVGDFGSSHIGISGLIYGLIGFLLTAGLLGRERQTYSLSIIVALLYGGFWWGFVPVPGVSWESHVFGFLSGILMAAFNRKKFYMVSDKILETPEFDHFFQEVDWQKRRTKLPPKPVDSPEQ